MTNEMGESRPMGGGEMGGGPRMGGPRAPLEAPSSIAGLRRVIDGLTPGNSGKFWLWSGERLPW